MEFNAEQLARFFHDTYEELAPQFGYETRKETRKFDKDSPNGKANDRSMRTRARFGEKGVTMDAIVLGRFQVQELERRVITNTVDPTLVRLSCWYCGLEHCGQIGAARLAAAAYIDGWRVIGQHGQVLQPVVACPVHVPLGTITLPTESEQPEEKKKCEFLGGA